MIPPVPPPPVQIWRHHGSRSLKMYGMAVVPEARLRRDAIIDLIEQGAPAFEV